MGAAVAASSTSEGSTGTGATSRGYGGGAIGEVGGAGGDGGKATGAGGGGDGPCIVSPDKSAFVASLILTDLASGPDVIGINPSGGRWFAFRDGEAGASMTPAPGAFTTESTGPYGGLAVHVVGRGFQPPASATNFGGGVGFELAPELPTDFSSLAGITFSAESGAVGFGPMSDILVEVTTTATDPAYCSCRADGTCGASYSFLMQQVPQSSMPYTIKWSDLQKPSIGTPVPFDPAQVRKIMFASNGPAPFFDFWIGDVRASQ
jgi:hypothetical protein